MKTLDLLSSGEDACVLDVHGTDSALRRRLLDMGLTRGTKVHFVREAPLGDPIEIKLRGYSLTVRKSDARLVEVQ